MSNGTHITRGGCVPEIAPLFVRQGLQHVQIRFLKVLAPFPLFHLLTSLFLNPTLPTPPPHIPSLSPSLLSGMSTTSSQAFRAQSSSKVVSIPTRYDDKRKLRVIRWKDIQLCFKDAEYIMYNGDVVLFLTDDDLEE